MPRLPQPGSDRGQWGEILNDFLGQSHNTDGTLKNNSVAASQITDDSITEVKLDSSVRTKLNTVGGTPLVESVAGKTGAVNLVKADVGLTNVDNTNDASKPISTATQTALDAKASASHTHPISDVTNLQATLDTKAATAATVQLVGNQTIIDTKNFTGSLQAGGQAVVTTNDARLTDQRVPTDNSVTVNKLSAGPANSDQVLSFDGSGLAWTTITPEGFISDASPTEKGIVQLAGDLSGTAGSPTVAKINGITLGGTPSAGHILTATSGAAASWQAAPAATVISTNITDSTATGRSVITAVDATAARTTLGLGNVNNTSDANKPISSATQAALDAAVAAVPETVRDTMGSALVAGTNITITPNDGADTITISASGGGGDSYFDTYVLNAADYGVVFDGTTNIRASFQSALTAALALTATGQNVILQLPSGVGPITTANGSSLSNVYTGGSYGTDHGFKLPVNMTGHLTIRGRGPRETVFKLSSNARTLFVINQAANYDVAQHFTFEDFGVDNNATTGLSHIVFGNQPNYDTPQRYMSFRDITMRRIDVWNVPFDHVMSTTKKLAFMFRGRHAGNYEAGTTPGSLPLTPYPGEAGAAAAKWTYAIDILAEDVNVYDAQRGIHVVCDITQETSHWIDRIRYERCLHEQAAPYVNDSPQTSFYIGGNCLGGRAEIIDCKSVNVGDDGIEFGGLQELYVRNFEVVNPILDGILVRYSQPPVDASSVKIVIDGLKNVITAEALNNDTPIDPEDSTAKRRSVRGRPFEIITENDFANGTLGQVIIRNSESIVEGGYFNTLIRSRMIGWNHTGPVAHTLIENCRAIVRNLHLDPTTGEYIVGMLSTRAATLESGVKPIVQIRNFEAIFENPTTSGAKYEVHGLWPMGDGEVDVDGFRLTLIEAPAASVVRSSLVAPGYRPAAFTTDRALSRLHLRRLSGRAVGTVVGVRRGILVQSTELFDNALVSAIDVRDWAVTADVDFGAAGVNAQKITFGEGNVWSRIDGGGIRNPQAANYTMRSYDGLIAITSTAAARTITLPAVGAVQPGRLFTVLDESNGAATNNITITRAGADTWLDGTTAKTINTNGGLIRFYSNGTVWITA